jgi:hypothetical protein
MLNVGKGRPKKLLTPDAVSKPTLEQMFGSRSRGTRLKRLAKFPEAEIRADIADLHAAKQRRSHRTRLFPPLPALDLGLDLGQAALLRGDPNVPDR